MNELEKNKISKKLVNKNKTEQKTKKEGKNN